MVISFKITSEVGNIIRSQIFYAFFPDCSASELPRFSGLEISNVSLNMNYLTSGHLNSPIPFGFRLVAGEW